MKTSLSTESKSHLTTEGISILMPVKNASSFIDRCIQSIVRQEVKWELIAVDDHSDDDSYEKLNTWATKLDNIRLFKNRNHGIIHALKTAFDHATYHLITRMDSDDEMPENKLDILFQQWMINQSEDPVVVGKVEYKAEKQLGGGYKRYEEWINNNLEVPDLFSHIYEECILPSCAWLMSSTRFKELTNETWDYPEDYDLCLKIYEKQIPVRVASATVHYWYDHANRTSRNSEVYSDQDFFDLKLKYFKRIDKHADKLTLLWGAGPKGKKLAKHMKKVGLEFEWVTENENKVGHMIYDQKVQAVPDKLDWEKHQVILALSGPQDKKDVVERLDEMSGVNGKDYYIFVN